MWFQIIIFGWSKNAFFKVYGTYLFIQAFNETIGARNNQKSENVKKWKGNFDRILPNAKQGIILVIC